MKMSAHTLVLACAAVATLTLGACSDGADVIGGAAAAAGDDTIGASGAGAAGRGAASGGASGEAEPGDGDMPAGTEVDDGLGGAPGAGGSSGSEGVGSSGSGGVGASGGATSGGAGGDGAVPGVTFVAPRGPCELDARVGRFSVEKQVDFGVVQGTVSEGVVPSAIPALVLDQSNCRLVERRNLVCSPACVGSETCGESGTCIPFPRQVSVGDVTISGLTKETRMSPQDPGNSYFAPGADNPPYQVQGEVVLSASGAPEVPAFQLFGVGSEPLAQAPSWVLEAGTDLLVEWAAPTAGVAATVLVELTIDQHGTSPLSLSCELPDTGSASVASGIIDQLLGAGISGFPNGRITRRTADHVDIAAGCVELTVGSPLAASVSVSGYTPCNGAGDCPEGQACNVPLQRCE